MAIHVETANDKPDTEHQESVSFDPHPKFMFPFLFVHPGSVLGNVTKTDNLLLHGVQVGLCVLFLNEKLYDGRYIATLGLPFLQFGMRYAPVWDAK